MTPYSIFWVRRGRGWLSHQAYTPAAAAGIAAWLRNKGEWFYIERVLLPGEAEEQRRQWEDGPQAEWPVKMSKTVPVV